MNISIVSNSYFTTWLFRRELMAELVRLGHGVSVLAPEEFDEKKKHCVDQLREMGCDCVDMPFHRFVHPVRDVKVLVALARYFRRQKPDMVFTMTVKPNIYGVLAAKWAGVERIVALAPGAGETFASGGGLGKRTVRLIAKSLYRLAGRHVDRFWFLNRNDRDLFVESKIIKPEQGVVIVSEGIDLDQFSPETVEPKTIAAIRNEFEANDETVVIGCYPGRKIWSKGVGVFIEAAGQAETWNLPVRFILIGSKDDRSRDSVPEHCCRDTANLKCFEFRSDIREVIAATDIMTLPSFYREGVPRILLEALAMKKPIVTTDHVGCRETVAHGANGFLVPPNDSKAFGDALKILASDREMRARLAENSRKKAEREFDIHKINRRVIAEVLKLSPFDEISEETNSTGPETVLSGHHFGPLWTDRAPAGAEENSTCMR